MNFSLDSEFDTLTLHGAEPSGLKPWQT